MESLDDNIEEGPLSDLSENDVEPSRKSKPSFKYKLFKILNLYIH